MIAKSVSIRKRNGKHKTKSQIPEKSLEKTQEKYPKKPKKKNNSKLIISILIVIICLILIWHFSQNNSRTNNKTQSAVIENQKSESTKMLDVGSYDFEMKAGEETGWIQMPIGKSVYYTISSPENNWSIRFCDGEVVDGRTAKALPHRDLAKFKLKSLKDQAVTINIVAN